MFAASLVRRMASSTGGGVVPQPFNGLTNPYKTKKVWPPDFSKLSPQAQLKFEKRYKRRVLLKSARPRWNKIIKLTQLFSVAFIVTYGALFMDWGDESKNPFRGLREVVWGPASTLLEEEKLRRQQSARERPLRDKI